MATMTITVNVYNYGVVTSTGTAELEIGESYGFTQVAEMAGVTGYQGYRYVKIGGNMELDWFYDFTASESNNPLDFYVSGYSYMEIDSYKEGEWCGYEVDGMQIPTSISVADFIEEYVFHVPDYCEFEKVVLNGVEYTSLSDIMYIDSDVWADFYFVLSAVTFNINVYLDGNFYDSGVSNTLKKDTWVTFQRIIDTSDAQVPNGIISYIYYRGTRFYSIRDSWIFREETSLNYRYKTATAVTPYIFTNGEWVEATAYVYHNGWEQAEPKIFYGGWK